MPIELKPAGVEIPVATLFFVKIPAESVAVMADDRGFLCRMFVLRS